MSLLKRGKVWWAYIYRDGIRHQYSTGTSNRRQAETIEAKLREEVNRVRFGVTEVDPRMTFGELAARFLASGSIRPHHIYHLKLLLPFFAEIQVLRMTDPNPINRTKGNWRYRRQLRASKDERGGSTCQGRDTARSRSLRR